MAIVISDVVCKALEDVGLLSDIHVIRRVVIDLQVGEPPVIHIERYGDERLLALARSLDGIEVEYVTAPEVAG